MYYIYICVISKREEEEEEKCCISTTATNERHHKWRKEGKTREGKEKNLYGDSQSSKVDLSMVLAANVHDTQEIKSFCSFLHIDTTTKMRKSNVNDMYMYITQLLQSKMKSILLTIYIVSACCSLDENANIWRSFFFLLIIFNSIENKFSTMFVFNSKFCFFYQPKIKLC